MKCDIFISAYNAADRIGDTLASLKEEIETSSFPRENLRVVLINNASTDATKEVASSFHDQMPLEIIDAPEPGKSKALNLTIQKYLKGDVVFLTDDDVFFQDGWLDNFLKAIESQPDYSVFAGRIVGAWEKEVDPDLASWIPMGSTFAIHERTESGPCDPGIAWGPNMAIRRSVLDAGIRYDERIGPTPDAFYAMGEDSGFAISAQRNGFKSYYVSDAVVRHKIKAASANEDWIIRRAERLGYGIFAIKTVEEYARKQRQFSNILPLSLEILILRLFWGLVYPATFLLPRCKQRFWLRWRSYYYKGLLSGFQSFTSHQACDEQK